jgi:hypothetical protein
MVKRYCPKCNAEFDRKSNYDYHINRKYNCVQNIKIMNDDKLILCENIHNLCKIIPDKKNCAKNEKKLQENNILIYKNKIDDDKIVNDKIDNNLICSYCNKYYSSKSALTRHVKDNCKIKKQKDDEKETIFKLLLEKDKQHKEQIKLHKEEVNELKKQNKLLLDKIDKLISMKEISKLASEQVTNTISNSNNHMTNSNNTTNTINTTNTQNNIVMVNFGKEDLSIIDERLFIDRIIKKPMVSGVKIPDEVLKIIHFNPTYPQLSNIYISDINRDKCMVWEDGEWKLSSIDNIPQIMDKICLFSNEQIEMLKNKYPNNKLLQDRLGVIKKYNNMIDNDYLEELKDDIVNNKNEIKRCEDFQKNTHNTLKKTLYNEGKKLKKTLISQNN